MKKHSLDYSSKRTSQEIRKNSQGFTLLELIVAIAVFALMSAAAYNGLYSSIKAEENFRKSMLDVEAMQMTFTLFQKEITQYMENRSIRDEFGSVQPPLTLEGGIHLAFSRGGNSSSLLPGKHELLRVHYLFKTDLETNQFIRGHWVNLDRSPGEEIIETTLLTDVEKVQFRILDAQNEWHEFWPAPNAALTAVALEIIIEREGWGEIRRVFAL